MNIIKHSLAILGMIAAPAFAAGQVSISIDAAKPGPVINKNVYGQFAEHLGTGVYEGAMTSSARSRSCMCRWCAGRAAASPIPTTGATA
jgi:hypothetical protein